MIPMRSTRSAWRLTRVAMCCALTLVGAAWSAAERVLVAGQVVNAGGKAVPGVTVRLAILRDDDGYTVDAKRSQVTGATGKFDFGSIDLQKSQFCCVLAVYEPGKYIGWAIGARLPASEDMGLKRSAVPSKIVVSKPTVATGVIVDKNGDPMAGVTVGYQDFQPRSLNADGTDPQLLQWFHPFESVVTGSDGVYRLTDIPALMMVTPTVEKKGYATDPYPLFASEGKTRIAMIPGGRVVGRIVDDRGRPRAGVQVCIEYAPTAYAGSTRSKQDGTFAIEAVPPKTQGLMCYDGGDQIIDGLKAVVKAGATTDVGDITMATQASVSGRVLDAETGKPIPDATILVRVGETAGMIDVSSADGSYSAKVDPGEATVMYMGGNPRYVPPSESEALKVTVTSKGSRPCDVRLTRAEMIHGTVVGVDGGPASGAVVRIGDDSRYVEAVTGADGKFTIGIPAEQPKGSNDGPLGIDEDTVVLRATETASGGAGCFAWAKRDDLLKDGVTMRLAPTKPTKICVVDEDGSPVTGASVSMEVWIGGASVVLGRKSTDRQGNASFSTILDGGLYGVTVTCDGYKDFSDGDQWTYADKKWKTTRKIVLTSAR